MRPVLMLAGMVIGAAAAGPLYAQTAGIVQFVAGEVMVVMPDGSARAARKGAAVSVGDTLTTPAGGLAQLKMGDGAIVVVQPQSRLTVAEFRYAGREDGTEKVRYRLEQGGFRAVTGAIGRTHKQNYVIETPIAHMGVRGTDHESYYFPATGPVSGDGAKPGAYNKVNTGRTFIRSGAGEVEVDPNQVGYVASAGDVPVILPGVPGFFNRSIAPLSSRRGEKPVPAAAEVEKVEQNVDSADGMLNAVRLVRTRGPRVTPGSGTGPLVGYTIAAGMGNAFGGSGNGVALAANGATDSNVGSDPVFGVNWHTWEGGLATIDGKATMGTTHVITADAAMKTSAADLAALGAANVMASYSKPAGAQFVTNYLGESGTINKLQVDVNFATQMVTRYDVDVTLRADWTASGSGSIAQFTGPTGIVLSGTCSGCTSAPSNPAAGTAHGTFVGSSAERLITTFGLNSGGGAALSGAAYLGQ